MVSGPDIHIPNLENQPISDLPPSMLLNRFHSTRVLRRRVETLSRHLAGMIPPNQQVLDVGCGDGQVARLLLSQRRDLKLTGVDVLVRPHTAVPVVAFDGHTLPYPDNAMDVVMLIDVLHHADDPRALLHEAARVSRHWVLIKDHTQQGWMAKSTLSLMDWIGNAHHGVALRYQYWTPPDWQDAWTVLRLRPVNTLTDLGLYPAWADWLFGRRLHFISLLEKNSGG